MFKRIVIILTGLITSGFLTPGVADAAPTSATTMAAAPTDAGDILGDVIGLIGHPVSI
ncbi:hypothetical protein [Streptomyces sp. TLI_185]|uniref:hypothetical protein n=1 Tax=Streptomyces sp. TLI_185 TaxID=2485151 RepID=UPI000FAC0938|nr:hypothetical protein [Streptomyces sp. TLI_185]RPF39122.1 hypothetical protein EDD92_9319 [Streptomyces sp. TLI_185]